MSEEMTAASCHRLSIVRGEFHGIQKRAIKSFEFVKHISCSTPGHVCGGRRHILLHQYLFLIREQRRTIGITALDNGHLPLRERWPSLGRNITHQHGYRPPASSSKSQDAYVLCSPDALSLRYLYGGRPLCWQFCGDDHIGSHRANPSRFS